MTRTINANAELSLDQSHIFIAVVVSAVLSSTGGMINVKLQPICNVKAVPTEEPLHLFCGDVHSAQVYVPAEAAKGTFTCRCEFHL